MTIEFLLTMGLARLGLMVTEADLGLSDGRTLHYYDTGEDDSDARVAVFWHHGTPNVGSPPEPLFSAAAENGLRWVSYDRPAYGGSSPNPGRDIASAAADVAAIADALGIGRFAVLGHSGGGPHALSCGALLPERVIAVVSGSAPAPFDAEGLDWFAGWSRSGVAEQRAALAGRAALEEYLPSAEFDPETFTPEDHAALEGRWSWLGEVVAPRRTSRCPSSSCTASRIGWCRARTVSGSLRTARLPSCGFLLALVTLRCSIQPRRLWGGCATGAAV